MATAAEKRSYVAKFAQQFANGEIYEPLKDNHGPTLNQWLTDNGTSISGWNNNYTDTKTGEGYPWCAAFVSAMGYWTDKQLGFTPKCGYANMDSQCSGAGGYGSVPQDARIGLAISWKHKTGGHAGLIIGVDNNGLYTVEGNTTGDISGGQNRNGDGSFGKYYKWNEINTTEKTFSGLHKLWDEDNSTLGEPNGQAHSDMSQLAQSFADNIKSKRRVKSASPATSPTSGNLAANSTGTNSAQSDAAAQAAFLAKWKEVSGILSGQGAADQAGFVNTGSSGNADKNNLKTVTVTRT